MPLAEKQTWPPLRSDRPRSAKNTGRTIPQATSLSLSIVAPPAERAEHCVVEPGAALELGDVEADVVDHARHPIRGPLLYSRGSQRNVLIAISRPPSPQTATNARSPHSMPAPAVAGPQPAKNASKK